MAGTLPVRLVVVAPRTGSCGPAYYVDRLLSEVRPHVAEVVEVRHGAAGEDSWADVRRWRGQVAEILAEPTSLRPVLHGELSGGALASFWALGDHPEVRRTATVHDPPRAVWFPFRTKGLARRRLLSAGLHRLAHRPLQELEQRHLRGVSAVALSPGGVAAARQVGVLGDVREGHLFVPPRPPMPALAERPAAVGLFGHVYRGKGFDHLAALRAGLPDDVALRVAGHGTQGLPALPGVEILGPVPDAELPAFFGSLRLLLLPYDRPPFGGHPPVPASLTHLTALAHGTPALALSSPQTDALAAEGGCRVLPDVPALARAAGDLVRDPDALAGLAAETERYLGTITVERSLAPYLQLWGAP